MTTESKLSRELKAMFSDIASVTEVDGLSLDGIGDFRWIDDAQYAYRIVFSDNGMVELHSDSARGIWRNARYLARNYRYDYNL